MPEEHRLPSPVLLSAEEGEFRLAKDEGELNEALRSGWTLAAFVPTMALVTERQDVSRSEHAPKRNSYEHGPDSSVYASSVRHQPLCSSNDPGVTTLFAQRYIPQMSFVLRRNQNAALEARDTQIKDLRLSLETARLQGHKDQRALEEQQKANKTLEADLAHSKKEQDRIGKAQLSDLEAYRRGENALSEARQALAKLKKAIGQMKYDEIVGGA